MRPRKAGRKVEPTTGRSETLKGRYPFNKLTAFTGELPRQRIAFELNR